MSVSSVLVLGAASDIGRAIASAYAKAGRNLILAARDPERLTRDVDDLQLRHRVEVHPVGFDVLDIQMHGSFLSELKILPEIVVCVVGRLGDQARSAGDPAEADLVMRTNYLAPALLLGEVANRMERRGTGTIIGISSVAGDRGRATNYVYGSAKAGFTAFLSGLRNRLARTGVHVVTIKPGFVDTGMTEGMTLPPLLTAQPDEVAVAVLRAEERRRNTVYVRAIWLPIMTVIGLIPERFFKRMKI